MTKDSGVSGLKIFSVGVLILIVLIGGFLLWRELGRGDFVTGPEKLAEKVADLTKENEDLTGRVDELESQQGISTGVFVSILLVAIILFFVFVNAYGQVGGKNIDRGQAKQIAIGVVASEFGWRNFLEYPGHYPSWKRLTVQTGQAVDGDIDTVWFICQFAKDWPEGGALAPGHQCVTVGIKSNDAGRQMHVEPGLNAREFAQYHKIKLQRNPQPSEISQELASLDVAASISEKIRSVTGEDS